MNRVLIDTNALVSFVTDRDADQQALSSDLLEEAAGGKVRVLLHQAVASEFTFVLQNLYEIRARAVADILKELLTLPGVEVLNELNWARVFTLWPDLVGDYGDALLAAVASSTRADSVATFDERFRRQLKRLGVSSFW